MLNQWMKIALLLCATAAFWCFADNFLAPEKPVARRSAQQMKQELVELMGDIIETESALIGQRAALQKKLCTHMRAYAHGEKKSFVARASVHELQRVIKVLRAEKDLLLKEKNRSERVKQEISSLLNI